MIWCMESPREFTEPANRLLSKAVSLAGGEGRDFSRLNRLMSEAKANGMSVVSGLEFAVERLSLHVHRHGADS